MLSRATQSVFWPGMKQDIIATRAHCTPCTKIAPSNPEQPPHPPVQPDFPFSHCCMDFFSVEGRTYLALVDRYTGWLSVFQLAKDDSSHVITTLREYFSRWGIAQELTSDGASVFTSAECKSFFHRWGVRHRVSSAYYPRANKRSEVAVKSSKRMIMENLGPKGQLDTDRFARALLLHRNTPDPMTGLSPAMILFGREIRDHLPAKLDRYQPRREWRMEADIREEAFAKRHAKMEDRLTHGSRPLLPLAIGDTVTVQDQKDPRKAGRWDKTGEIIEILPHESYIVRIHGSRAPTQRNRKFLRKISPFHPMIPLRYPEPVPHYVRRHQDQFAAVPPLTAPPQDPSTHQQSTPTVPDPIPSPLLGPIPAETKPNPVESEHIQSNLNPPTTQSPTSPPKVRRRPIKEKWIVNPKFQSKVSSILHSDELQEAIGEVLFLLMESSGDHEDGLIHQHPVPQAAQVGGE